MSRRDPYDMFSRQAHGPSRPGRQLRPDPRGLSPEALEQIRREYARMEQELRTVREEREALLRERQAIAVELTRLREALAQTGSAAPAREASPQADTSPGLEGEHRALSARYTELQQDLNRLRERQQAELAKARAAGAEAVLSELLDMADNLDRAIGSAPDTDSAWFTGLVALRKQLVAALQRQGIERFGAVGDPFDPRLHEATATRPATGDLPEGRVVSIERAGFRRADGSVVRPALVVVSAGSF